MKGDYTSQIGEDMLETDDGPLWFICSKDPHTLTLHSARLLKTTVSVSM